MTWDGARVRFRAKSPITAMLKQNRLDPTLGFFWCVVLLHVLLWTFLTAETQPNVPSRTLELLSAGRDFAWGYPTQPPMGVWVAAAVSAWAAPSIWPLYLLAQACGVVSVWAAWIMARKFLHPWTALCGAIVLLGGYSCTIASSEFSSSHLASVFWSLAILSFYEALTQEKRRYWAATGLLLALGLLSSYGTFLLIVTMFVFTLWDERARRCWDSSWPFLAGLMMAVILLPHMLWLGRHQFQTIQNGLAPASSVAHHLEQPLAYLGTQLLCLIPVILLLAPLIAWFSFEEPATGEETDRDFARQYLLWMTCLPPAVIFALSLLAGPSSAIFASVTNWTFLGIALLLWGHVSETRLAWRRSLLRIGTAVGFFAASLVAINVMLPHVSRQGFNTQFPGSELARGIELAWRRAGYNGHVPVIAGPRELARNAAWHATSSSKIALYEDLNPANASGVNDQLLSREGGIVIWDMSAAQQHSAYDLSQRFGRVSLLEPLNMKWRGAADLPDIRIGMAVVHPAIAQTTPPATFPVATTPISTLPANYPRAAIVPASSTQPVMSQSNTFPTSLPASYQYPASSLPTAPHVESTRAPQALNTYSQGTVSAPQSSLPAASFPSTTVPAMTRENWPTSQPQFGPVNASQPISQALPATSSSPQNDPFGRVPAKAAQPAATTYPIYNNAPASSLPVQIERPTTTSIPMNSLPHPQSTVPTTAKPAPAQGFADPLFFGAPDNLPTTTLPVENRPVPGAAPALRMDPAPTPAAPSAVPAGFTEQ